MSHRDVRKSQRTKNVAAGLRVVDDAGRRGIARNRLAALERDGATAEEVGRESDDDEYVDLNVHANPNRTDSSLQQIRHSNSHSKM